MQQVVNLITAVYAASVCSSKCMNLITADRWLVPLAPAVDLAKEQILLFHMSLPLKFVYMLDITHWIIC